MNTIELLVLLAATAITAAAVWLTVRWQVSVASHRAHLRKAGSLMPSRGLRSVDSLVAIGCVIVGFGLAYPVYQTAKARAADALASYRAAEHSKTIDARDRITTIFRDAYHQMRTIARLPGIKSLDRHARDFDPDAKTVVQEIYNNLAQTAPISELYIVPIDFDPDAIDSTTEHTQSPIATFDHLIIGQTDGEPAEATGASGIASTETEEIEIFEYRLMKSQLATFKARFPHESDIAKLSYPAISGPEVITCDNSRFNPHSPDNADRSGLVYSVPFYGTDGQLKGCISAVMLTTRLKEALGENNRAIVCVANNYAAAGQVAGTGIPAAAAHEREMKAGTACTGLLYSETLRPEIIDIAGPWTLWAATGDENFISSPAAQTLARDEIIGYIAAAVVSLLFGTAAWSLLTAKARAEALAHSMTAGLAAAKTAAEAANAAKSSFLANMSHEIRTPINGVSGALALLNRTKLSEQQIRFTDIAKQSADALLRVVNDVLDISKIESGGLELETTAFDIRPCIMSVADVVAIKAAEKNVELVCVFDTNLPQTLEGDPTRLSQITLNLVNNAIKFTPSGSVVIHVSREHAASNTTAIRIEVTDSGIGIPADRIDKLFKPFTQVDASTTRKYGGTGLGLAICAKLIDLMGGKIGIRSTPGHGATFWFVMPIRFAEATTPALSLSSQSGPARVLVVDDSPPCRESIAQCLASWGVLFQTAASGAEAIEHITSAARAGTPFDAAVIDNCMPEMTGFELACAIRNTPIQQPPGLVLISSRTENLDPTVVAAAGFGGTLCKPVSPSQLFDTLRNIMGIANQQHVKVAAKAHDKTKPPQGGHILLAEDNEINRMIAREILFQAGFSVEDAVDGKQAVTLASTGTFDAVLMDCQMPEMDGMDASRALRQAEAAMAEAGLSRSGSKLPIIALTANAFEADRVACLDAGMNDYLSKPINPESLVATLAKYVHPSRNAAATPLATVAQPQHDGPSTAAPSPGPETEPPVTLSIDTGRYTPSQSDSAPAISGREQGVAGNFDAGELLMRCGGRRDFAAGIVTQFVSTISNLTEEISTAARSGDAAAVASLAHQFGGAASTMGCRALCTACTEIETLADHGSTDSVAFLLPNLTAIGEQTEQTIARWLAEPTTQDQGAPASRAAA